MSSSGRLARSCHFISHKHRHHHHHRHQCHHHHCHHCQHRQQCHLDWIMIINLSPQNSVNMLQHKLPSYLYILYLDIHLGMLDMYLGMPICISVCSIYTSVCSICLIYAARYDARFAADPDNIFANEDKACTNSTAVVSTIH